MSTKNVPALLSRGSASPRPPITQRLITAGGVRARVIEQGQGDPILLVHGVGGWAENWRYTLPALAGAGFRAIACDLPGFGLSQRPPDVRYLDPVSPYYVSFIRDVLDALAIPRASLVGHSLGGTIAAVTAACVPGRVHRLGLVAPGGFGVDVPARLCVFGLPFSGRLARFTPEALVHSFVRSNFCDPGRIPAWLYQEATSYHRAGRTMETARVLRQLATSRRQRDELRRAWRPRLADLRQPTLIVWGLGDRTMPATHVDSARALLPLARVELFANTGHMPMIERAADFNHALLRFLARGEGARDALGPERARPGSLSEPRAVPLVAATPER